jgi:transposase
LRSIALGGKNYFFVGTCSGGERAATMYAIGTCKLNGINPDPYLTYVVKHIADYPVNRIADLLS